MLELTVKTLDSQNHSFTVPDETTVRQLKESILEKMGVPIEIQRLIFHGKVLQDEKKLTDYGDVDGKVIHLVQRPPPPSRSSNTNNGAESNPRGTRRSHYNSRDRIDGSSSTYLGTMAFPTDFIEPQGMIQLPPSQRLSRRRLMVAQRMLNQAAACITALENNEAHQSTPAESQETAGASNFASSNASSSGGREEADMFLGETTGSIARAAQAATAAAIAAAVSTAHSVVPHITVRGASGQNDSPNSNLDNTNSNMSDINLNLNINDNHPEDVAVEVEIGANSDVSVDECHEGDSIANNLDNNPSGSNNAPPRLNVERTSSFATLIEQLEEQQRRFQGLLRRCHQLMVEDPPLTENSSPNAEECQRLFNGVSETMHHFAHAYHALSDIMVDFNEDTPRTLRCRPVIIQHSAILETVFPIQAQINLTRRNANDNNSNSAETPQGTRNTTAGATPQPVPETQSTPTEPQRMRNTVAGVVPQSEPETTPTTTETPQRTRTTLIGVAPQPESDAPLAATEGSQRTRNPTVVGVVPQPESEIPLEQWINETEGNVTPQESASSFTSTTTQQSEERSQSLSQIGGSGRSPIELLQSVQAVAGQIQNHLMGRMNPTSQSEQPPPYEANVQQTTSESGVSNQSASSRAQSSTSTESTTTSPNISTSRPHVHVGRAIPDVALNSYDPFLPCNSHHIRPQNRSANRNSNSQSANARTGNENERPNANPERDSFMAMMTQLLNPQRVLRTQPRQGTSTGATSTSTTTTTTTTANVSNARSTPRRPSSTPSQAGEGAASEMPRTFTWTPLPNIAGWSVSATPASPGARRNLADYSRVLYNASNGTNAPPGASLSPGTTIAEFLSTIYDSSYVEGESIVSDFLMTLARNLSWPDLIELSMAQRTMVESIVTRLHPALQTFVLQRLLQGETPSEENIARACERLYSEFRPYIDVMQVARLKESIDLAATINNFNQSQIPEIVCLIVDPYLSRSPNFGATMTQRVRNYVRQLLAIIIYCCQDGVQGFDAIVQSCVRLLSQGVPEDLQQWTETNSVNNLRYYTATLNVPLEDIQRYLVYRIPNATTETNGDTAPTENAVEPMETDAVQSRASWTQPETAPPSAAERVDEPITESLVDLDAEGLPDVLIGSETWHNALPSEWVPIIARDTQRQRRQSSQKPFSDAYLSGLPPKRRKLIASSRPQGNLSQVISEGVRHAISAAGVSSTAAEKAIAEAGKDDVLQEAYKEQEKAVVGGDLKKHPDFTPRRFPNAFKYFNK